MTSIGVLHVIDSLDVGGAERVAVNLVNSLPRERYRPHLCATRRLGLLVNSVRPDVTLLNLARRSRFDLGPITRITSFLRRQDIRVVHAHGPALFLSKVAAMSVPGTTLIWHAHYGGMPAQTRRTLLYRLACRGTTVIAVSEGLAEWIRIGLDVPPARVHYLQNFTDVPDGEPGHLELPGKPGFRIVCVANIRAEKDHLTLLQAFATVARRFPKAHVLLVGAPSDRAYYDLVLRAVTEMGLADRVSFMGPVEDVYTVLSGCDVAVLSSAIEGLPMSLLEYGAAGLATVATRVGQCPRVLNDGSAGILVDPRSPGALAIALEELLESPQKRKVLGEAFRSHVKSNFSRGAVVASLCRIYDSLCFPRSLAA